MTRESQCSSESTLQRSIASGSQKVFHLFLLISNLQTVFYLPKTLQTITFETLQPIPSDLYDLYKSSVNHEGLEKLLKLRIKTKLDRICIAISVSGLINVPILLFGY